MQRARRNGRTCTDIRVGRRVCTIGVTRMQSILLFPRRLKQKQNTPEYLPASVTARGTWGPRLGKAEIPPAIGSRAGARDFYNSVYLSASCKEKLYHGQILIPTGKLSCHTKSDPLFHARMKLDELSCDTKLSTGGSNNKDSLLSIVSSVSTTLSIHSAKISFSNNLTLAHCLTVLWASRIRLF